MDSRLLNVFHDDTFDSGYTQLNTDFWSSESDTMGQLTETLHGILPISPDAEPHTDLYSSALLDTEDNFRIANKIDATSNLQNKELLVYGDFTQPQLSTNSIDIITANPNSYDSDSDDDTDYNEDADDDQLGVADIDNTNLGIHIVDFDDNRSHCSDATFRTRTDSSSIADYESHTSDYDDSSDNDDENVGNITNNHFKDIIPSSATEAILLAEEDIPDLTAGLLETDGIDLDSSFQLHLEDIAVRNKNRSLSTNTIDSDVDVNNFDLAEFITNDEVTLTVPKQKINNVVQPKPSVAPPKHLAIPVKSNIDTDSDVDSDIIVDIETVDVDNEKSLWELASESAAVLNDNDVAYEDNVKKDPSWSPKAAKKDTAPKEVKTRPSTAIAAPSSTTSNNLQNTRNFTIIPSKRQCDILKGKASTGKNKSTTKQVPSKPTTKKGPDATAGNASKAGSLTCRVGVGQSGKNLSLLSQIISADESKPQTNETLKTEEKKSEPIQPTIQDIQVSPEKFQKETALQQTKLAVKRKLNLEEYKRRRGGNAPAGQIECDKTSSKTQTISKSATQNSQVKHSQEVTSVVKSLRNQVGQKPPVDPITDAKNKVLRLQELKRAQQLKMIDSTISAKVPRVTKLPPLKDIVKDTYYADNNGRNQAAADAKLHTDYEELIIVSAGCNTEISIPPLNILPINVCERSLLKSSALLYNMPKGLTSSSSLIASIQDVVVQKVVGPEKSGIANSVTTPLSEKTRIEAEQHGEDKVIMHLRKDRIRPQTVSIGVQTDLQPGFVRLPKIPLKQRAPRNFRKHSGKDDSDSDASCVRSRIRSSSPVNRSRSRSADSYESSVERGGGVRQCDAAGGYSSRSSRRHRSSISSSYSESGCISRATQRQSRTSYKKRTKKYAHNSSVSSSSSSDMSDRSRSRSRSQSRSRSRGHSRSRSRSRSPYYRRSYVKSRSRSRSRSISRASNRFRKPGGHNNFANGNVSQPAVEERRIVYVGRIEEDTTKEILRRKFLPYGTIKQISIHYKDTGMKYGFVTYERSQDAFTVIDSSARDPTINMYDISFGGRRAFCRSSYADLDNAGINTYHSVVFPKVQAPPKEEDSFEALLQKVKAKMSANKVGGGTNTIKA